MVFIISLSVDSKFLKQGSLLIVNDYFKNENNAKNKRSDS